MPTRERGTSDTCRLTAERSSSERAFRLAFGSEEQGSTALARTKLLGSLYVFQTTTAPEKQMRAVIYLATDWGPSQIRAVQCR